MEKGDTLTLPRERHPSAERVAAARVCAAGAGVLCVHVPLPRGAPSVAAGAAAAAAVAERDEESAPAELVLRVAAAPERALARARAPREAAAVWPPPSAAAAAASGSPDTGGGGGGGDDDAHAYGGGFRVWECATDLVAELFRPVAEGDGGAPPLHERLARGARVLELGCGHGLPGIVALLLGASEVVFQDLNAEVLEHATRPNVAANCAAALAARARFVAGDWGAPPPLGPGRFDIILSSETLYDPALYPSVLALLDALLEPEPERGVALFATKSYYFGTGGGAREFVDRLEECGFAADRIRRVQDGMSNSREIVVARRRVVGRVPS